MKKKFSKILGTAVALVMVLSLAVALGPAALVQADPAALEWETIPLPKIGVHGNYVLTPGADVGPIAVTPGGKTLFAAAGSEGETISYRVTTAITGAAMDVTINYLNEDGIARATTLTIPLGTAATVAPAVTGSITLSPMDASVTDLNAATGVVGTGAIAAQGVVDIVNDTTLAVMGTYTDAAPALHGGYADGALVVGNPSLKKSTDGGYTWKLQDGFREEADKAPADVTAIVDIEVSPDYASDSTMFVATTLHVYQSVDGGKAFTQMTDGWVAGELITDIDVILDSGGRPSIIVGTATGAYAGDVYVYCPATTGMGWQVQDVDMAVGKSTDVLAVAFSPNFADDDGISAVTAHPVVAPPPVTPTGRTRMQFAFGATKDGGDWGAAIGPAKLLTKEGNDIASTRARIAYPDDFAVDSVTANVAFVGISGVDTGVPKVATAGAQAGDAYKVVLRPLASSAVDLNARGLVSAWQPTAVDIWSIDVSGDAEAANIMVGTDYWDVTEVNYYWLTYYSTDSGETWKSAAKKSPTGSVNPGFPPATITPTNVVMAPDFVSSGVAYGSTSGDASGFSRTADGGKSWNQISLIDYTGVVGGYTAKFAALSAATYAADETIYMTTQAPDGANGVLWKTTNAGTNWERIWSYGNPTIVNTINNVRLTADDTVFAVSYAGAKIYRSSDGGATFPTTITAKAAMTTIAVTSPTTIYTAHAAGKFYYTTKSGTPWIDPEDSEMDGVATHIAVAGDTILVPQTDGKVFISSDAGETFERIGISDKAGLATVTLDGGYATNRYIYAAHLPGSIYRCEVDIDDPDTSEWKNIEDGVPAVTNCYGIAILIGNILYGASQTAGTGMWRSVNPDADIEGLEPPYFESENEGLAATDTVAMVGATVFPNGLLCLNGAAANYYDQLVYFADTLDSGVTLMSPAAEASGVGVMLVGAGAPTVTLTWEAMPRATSYQYQVAIDEEFKGKEFDLYTTSQRVKAANLDPGEIYYWRVRVAQLVAGAAAGAPLITPWSEVRSFSTILGAGPTRPNLVAPYGGAATGGVDAQLKPAFQWTQVYGATSYQLQVTQDATFASVLTDKSTGTETSWQCDQDLGYSETYFWRVKAVGVTESPWSDVGSFTTMAKAVEPTPPVVVHEYPPAEAAAPPIPPAILWAIIGIGAVLVIAVIVLIVRTRRVV